MVSLEQSIHKDLSYVIRKLNEIDNATDFDSLAAIYDVLNKIASLNNIDTIECDEIDELYKKYDIDSIVNNLNKRIINNYSNNYKLNKKFASIVKDLKDPYKENEYVPKYETRISNNKTIDYVKDFYKNYDDDIYSFIKDYLKHERLFFIDRLFETSGGCILDCGKFLKPYTFIESDYTICDFNALVHELMHIYFQNIEVNYTEEEQMRKNLNNFGEVYSEFIELIAMDYLKDTSFNKDEVYSLKVEYDNDMIENLALYNKLLFKKKRYLNNLEIFINSEMYAYGKVLAYHFYEQYKDNKEEAKKNIKQFYLDSILYNKKHLLNDYGLDKSEVYTSKVLKKNIY